MLRLTITALAIVLLAACATLAEPTATVQQNEGGDTITLTPPDSDCYVVATLENDRILFSASEACVENTAIPFRIIDSDGNVKLDGGVYAGGSPTLWLLTHTGTFEIRHANTNALIGVLHILE